jgi:hypothetical protein
MVPQAFSNTSETVLATGCWIGTTLSRHEQTAHLLRLYATSNGTCMVRLCIHVLVNHLIMNTCSPSLVPPKELWQPFSLQYDLPNGLLSFTRARGTVQLAAGASAHNRGCTQAAEYFQLVGGRVKTPSYSHAYRLASCCPTGPNVSQAHMALFRVGGGFCIY